MKTANVDTVPREWPEILEWLRAGEEVELCRGKDAVARVVPLPAGGQEQPAAWPDFVGRARRIWGESRGSLTDALIEERNERA